MAFLQPGKPGGASGGQSLSPVSPQVFGGGFPGEDAEGAAADLDVGMGEELQQPGHDLR